MKHETTETVRAAHRRLLAHVEHIRDFADQVPEMTIEEREAPIERIVTFLNETLVPHAIAEERHLYPVVADMLGSPESTAPMVHDHGTIRALTARLDQVDPADTTRLEELLYGLYALIVEHFHKEEDLYLPMLERDPARARAVMDAMREGHARHLHQVS